jgi:hypothetical protein
VEHRVILSTQDSTALGTHSAWCALKTRGIRRGVDITNSL